MTKRQITDLPVATEVNDNDIAYVRQGAFDVQAEVELIRNGLLRSENNLSDIDDPEEARNNLNIPEPGNTLLAENNLNDVDSASDARSNLDVPSNAEALLVSNNLSDIDNAEQARNNLGVPDLDDAAVTNDTNDFDFNVQDKMQIRNYSETVEPGGNISGTHSIDLANGNVHSVTVTGDVDISFTGAPSSGQSGSVSLIITDGGNHAITWTSNVLWPGGNVPELTENGTDVIVFFTTDGGSTWYGMLSGLDFS